MDKNYLDYLEKYTAFTNSYNKEIYFANKGRDDIQPPVEPEIGRFLAFLVKLTGAKKVLELGCGVANSTIWLAQAVKENGGILYTVDNHPRTWAEAVKNVENSGLKDYVKMIHSNAEDAVADLIKQEIIFDFVFQDCGKYVYNKIYDAVVNLVCNKGLIAADDTMFQVCDGVRKNLGLHMDKYNQKMFSDSRFFSTMIPIGHGMTLSYKI